MDPAKMEKLAAWIASILASCAVLGKWIFPWIDSKRQKKSVIRGLQTLHAIYSAMERGEDYGATRAIIFGGHNSGGLPRPGSPYYTSALHWNVPNSKSARIADYREVSVDSHYIRMLLDIERNGYIRFDMSEGSPDCLLKRLYLAEHVYDSIVFFLCITDKIFFYMTFASYERRFTDNEITELNLQAQLIALEIKNSK